MCIGTSRRRASITKLPSATVAALMNSKPVSDFAQPQPTAVKSGTYDVKSSGSYDVKASSSYHRPAIPATSAWAATALTASAARAANPHPAQQQPQQPIVQPGVDYRDFSHEPPPPACDQNKFTARGGVTVPFPLKLHQLLDKIEADGLAHVVSWQPHGRCFVVHQPKEFVSHVMPKYFKQSKFASFQRQLNLYGFNRLTSGMDRGGYYHEMFLRGMPHLARRILRKRVKGTGVRTASCPESEPNFYGTWRPVGVRGSSLQDQAQQQHHQQQHAAGIQGQQQRWAELSRLIQQQQQQQAPSPAQDLTSAASSFVPIKLAPEYQDDSSPTSPRYVAAAPLAPPPTVVEHIVHKPFPTVAVQPSLKQEDVAAQLVRQVTPPYADPASVLKEPPKAEAQIKWEEDVKQEMKEQPPQQQPPQQVHRQQPLELLDAKDDAKDMDEFFENLDAALDLDEEQMDCLFDDISFGYMLDKAVDEM